MKTAAQLELGGRTRHSVGVRIEKLILHGFAPADRHRIADAVERELARWISTAGLPEFRENPPALDRINAGAFSVKAGTKPQAVGTEIAWAVARSLRQKAGILGPARSTRPATKGGRP